MNSISAQDNNRGFAFQDHFATLPRPLRSAQPRAECFMQSLPDTPRLPAAYIADLPPLASPCVICGIGIEPKSRVRCWISARARRGCYERQPCRVRQIPSSTASLFSRWPSRSLWETHEVDQSPTFPTRDSQQLPFEMVQ